MNTAIANLIAAAMFLVPFGRIADIYGRKKIFAYGVFIYIIASLAWGRVRGASE